MQECLRAHAVIFLCAGDLTRAEYETLRLLRETGKPKRGPDRKFVRDENGKIVRVPGRFTELQGGGWYIEEYGRAQLTFNLMNYKITSLPDVFDACREEAAKLGVRVTGSELVGLIPLVAAEVLEHSGEGLRGLLETLGEAFLDLTGTALIVSFLFMLGPQGLFIEFRGGAVLVLVFMMVLVGSFHGQAVVGIAARGLAAPHLRKGGGNRLRRFDFY